MIATRSQACLALAPRDQKGDFTSGVLDVALDLALFKDLIVTENEVRSWFTKA